MLYEAMTTNPVGESRFAMGLVGKIRACGGFRVGAPNFVGFDAIANAKSACDGVGFVLADDGTLSPKVSQLFVALSWPMRCWATRGAHSEALCGDEARPQHLFLPMVSRNENYD